jgi:hypothetical protein
MKRLLNRLSGRARWSGVAALAAAAGLATAIPALGQDGPESLLPPGFGTPAPAPSGPTPPVEQPSGAIVAPPPPDALSADAIAAEAAATTPEEAEAYTLPPQVSEPIDVAGLLTDDNGGYGSAAFGQVDGRYLVGLMRRLDAPVPSRWAQIVLRRALLTRVPTPPNVRPADWVAERAWLLLRMGDVNGAQLLVGRIGADRYSPRLYGVAAQVALTSGDIGLICPIAENGAALSKETFWPLARAICAGLGGESSLAAALIDQARDRRQLPNFDLLLAERLASAGSGGRRAVNIDWTEASTLNTFRYGLATAGGIEIPERLLATAPSRLYAWRASAPELPVEARIASARIGASIGIASSADLVDLYAALADEADSYTGADTPAGRLRTAYVADDMAERIAALGQFWKAENGVDGYAAQIASARAAARIVPDARFAEDADRLVGAMLSAGLDRQALRWWPVVADRNEPGDLAWALLAAGAPGTGVTVTRGRLVDWADSLPGGADSHRAGLALAALAGLGRIEPEAAQELAARFGTTLEGENRWLIRLDRAAAAGRKGEVALLAAVGMQTPVWAGVPAVHLYRIVAALKRVGLEPEARMIAAEAIARS